MCCIDLKLDLTFPYPIRTIAWHPAQHLLAVAMVNPFVFISSLIQF